ncbi:DUF7554 family protein [Halobellus limi]|jgi:hypothetical protein|uniref:Uncharacterized protein n=1 Tax=Halobellus limi TaxID=699433 RepID=A0A1H5WUI2_9EURY|nr:hypothetical protein [Halobellus limi]QCC46333.1 hypothetical protein DV707_00800 [Halobellus limi]SEG03209.1 hypothetical protein SAMN04488133_1403 [Halobellus limi]
MRLPSPGGDRAALEVEDLLKIVLVLVVILLVLEILDAAFGLLFGFAGPLVGLVIIVLIVLWLLDRI